jgi:magnesium chelatase accessory protein
MLKALDLQPAMVVGHSAGAAVSARLMLLHLIAPVPMVSLNGALSPMPQHQGALYSLMARLLTNSPATSWIFALQARREKTVDRLLKATGSRVDAEGRKFYGRLMSRPGHVGGALRMMARWNLDDLDLTQLDTPVTLIVGDTDGMVPPEDALRVQARLPQGRVVTLPGLGHLAHEEEPGMVARLIEEALIMDQPERGQPMALANCA